MMELFRSKELTVTSDHDEAHPEVAAMIANVFLENELDDEIRNVPIVVTMVQSGENVDYIVKRIISH